MRKTIKRAVIELDDCALVPLNLGYFAIIDKADIGLVGDRNWTVYPPNKTRRTAYCAQKRVIDGEVKTVYMHRLLINAPSGAQVDHIDGNGLNNRRANLRLCDASQNKMNIGPTSRNTSGHRGVTWDKANNKWMAVIRFKGKIYALGRFAELSDAAAAYRNAALRIAGEFSFLSRKEDQP